MTSSSAMQRALASSSPRPCSGSARSAGWRTRRGSTATRATGRARGPVEIEIPKGRQRRRRRRSAVRGGAASSARRSSASTPASAASRGDSRPAATCINAPATPRQILDTLVQRRRRRAGRRHHPRGEEPVEIAEHPRRRRHRPQGRAGHAGDGPDLRARPGPARRLARGLPVPRHLPAAAAHAGGARADPAWCAATARCSRSCARRTPRACRICTKTLGFDDAQDRDPGVDRREGDRPDRRSGRASRRCSSTGCASRTSRPSCCRPIRPSSTAAPSRCRARTACLKLGRPHPPHPARGSREPVQHVHARGPAAGAHREPGPRGARGGHGARPHAVPLLRVEERRHPLLLEDGRRARGGRREVPARRQGVRASDERAGASTSTSEERRRRRLGRGARQGVPSAGRHARSAARPALPRSRARARRRDLRRGARRGRLHDGPERRGQVDARAHPGRPAAAVVGPRDDRGPRRRRGRARAAPERLFRRGRRAQLPLRRLGAREPALLRGAPRPRRAAGGVAPTSCSSASASRPRPTGATASTRAACASASRSRAASSASPRCCCSTSRRWASTRWARATCASSCATRRSAPRAARPSCAATIPTEARALADRVLFLERGRLVARGRRPRASRRSSGCDAAARPLPGAVVWFGARCAAFVRRELVACRATAPPSRRASRASSSPSSGWSSSSRFVGAAANPHMAAYGGNYLGFVAIGFLATELQTVGVAGPRAARAHGADHGHARGRAGDARARLDGAGRGARLRVRHGGAALGARTCGRRRVLVGLELPRTNVAHASSSPVPLVLAAFIGLGLFTARQHDARAPHEPGRGRPRLAVVLRVGRRLSRERPARVAARRRAPPAADARPRVLPGRVPHGRVALGRERLAAPRSRSSRPSSSPRGPRPSPTPSAAPV